MRFSLKQLKRLPVETQSGMVLGRVFDLILEAESQSIVQYIVKPSFFSAQIYAVHRDQVLSMNNEKIMVEDNVEKISEKKQSKLSREPEPVAMTEIE